VTFHLRYPTGPADAEALLVDPITGDLLILTKALLGQAAVLRAPAASLVDGATVTMEEAGSVRIPLITAADVSADGRRLVVRTYAQVLDFERPPGATVAATLQGAPCAASDTAEPQGEAIALTDGGTAYLTISEGRFPDIHRVALAEPRMEGWFAGTLDTAVDAAVAATRRARPSS
jgi:hypothetical protein